VTPEELLYAKTHEWVHVATDTSGSQIITLGFSSFALEALTDLVFLELPEVGRKVETEKPFGEVESVARECRFSDCRHESEPGCAVRAAIEAGTLAPERVASHHKLEAERHYAELRSDERARRVADRKLGRFFKQHKKNLRRQGRKDY